MKKWYNSILTALVCLMLSSCYSFNQITLPKDTSATDIRIARLIVDDVNSRLIGTPKPNATNVQPLEGCALYILPDLPKTPELPYNELAKANPNDPSELDDIQSRHIDELRRYIDKLKKDLRAHHNEYVARCSGQAGKK